jgi:hypothetical protein
LLSSLPDDLNVYFLFLSKITSHEMMKNFTLVAIAGPTDQDQPPFVWSNSTFDKTVSHIGHPDAWNFTEFRPTWLPT